MLDAIDFIAERGGDPEKIRESQRRRSANVEIVDEIIALWNDHRKSTLISPVKAESTTWPASLMFGISQLQCHASKQQDQRGSEANWRQEEGQERLDCPFGLSSVTRQHVCLTMKTRPKKTPMTF